MIRTDELQHYLSFAREIAREAGQLTLAYFRRNPETQVKADRTPVTIADRESETLLRRRIRERYPRHGILGEEEGPSPGADAFTWVVDPIDGTIAFVAGVPLYAVLVALVAGRYDGTEVVSSAAVEVGVIYIPAIDEMVSAGRGLGTTWNAGLGDIRAHVSTNATVAGARIGTTDLAGHTERDLDFFRILAGRAGLVRTWGDAYGYLLVATGRLDVMIDPEMSPWDIGPLPVIIEEAGGRFTDVDGRAIIGTSALATNGAVHDSVLSLRH